LFFVHQQLGLNIQRELNSTTLQSSSDSYQESHLSLKNRSP